MQEINKLLTFLLPALLVLALAGCVQQKPWAIYYGEKASPDALDDYQIVVIDADRYPKLGELVQRDTKVYAYISLGEAHQYAPYREELLQAGALHEENKQWQGNRIIDIRDTNWYRIVLNQRLPRIVDAKVDGIMIDTLDSPLYLEHKDPVTYAGMQTATVKLVKAIKQKYPQLSIIVNRGFAVLPELLPYIDGVIAESTLTDYDFTTTKYRLRDSEEYRAYAEQLQALRLKKPDLLILALDYWPPEDETTRQNIKQAHTQQGFVPHISTISLDSLP